MLFRQIVIHIFGNLPTFVLNLEHLGIEVDDFDMGLNLVHWLLMPGPVLWIHGVCWAKAVLALGRWVQCFDIGFV